jgi:hypothetical protein
MIYHYYQVNRLTDVGYGLNGGYRHRNISLGSGRSYPQQQ